MLNLFLCNKYELKFFLMFGDVNVESQELIQLDITGASLAIPPLKTEATTNKVLYLFHHSFCYKLIQTS